MNMWLLSKSLLYSFRFPWRLWASYRASSRTWACTQTRRPSTPCQRSLTCPNTPSSNSSRTSGTMSSTTVASRSWARGLQPAEVWTSVNTEKKSCFQAPRTQNPARMELRKSTNLQRGVAGAQGGLQTPPAPFPASHLQGLVWLKRTARTRGMAGLGATWPLGAPHLVLESRLTTRGRDWQRGEDREQEPVRKTRETGKEMMETGCTQTIWTDVNVGTD